MMKSSDVLEFCGLCCTAIRISNVMQYLQYATPIFPNTMMIRTTSSTSNCINHLSQSQLQSELDMTFPQQRLQYLQRLFLRAIGYDPDYATTVIQHMFYNNNENSIETIDVDTNVISVFRNMEQLMEQTLNDITNNITKETFMGNNNNKTVATTDHDDDDGNNNNDGVTRIVAVTYSEKYLDAQTGQEIMNIHPHDYDSRNNHHNIYEDSHGAPRSLTMNDDTLIMTTTTPAKTASAAIIDENASTSNPKQLNSNDEIWKQQTAQLKQEILGELLSMRDEEREIQLHLIHTVVEEVMDHMKTLPQPQDRILYLTNLDDESQRCLAMKKIWDTHVATK